MPDILLCVHVHVHSDCRIFARSFLLQFNQFMVVIREMLDKVESDHQTYLEQLSKMEEQTK